MFFLLASLWNSLAQFATIDVLPDPLQKGSDSTDDNKLDCSRETRFHEYQSFYEGKSEVSERAH